MRRALILAAIWLTASAAVASELSDAIDAGDLAKVKALIAAGTDVTKGDMFGTPLHTAVVRGNVDIVAALLDAGAKIDARGVGGARPLHSAAIANKPEVAKLLVDRGAELEPKNGEGLTPLLVAASNGNVEVAEVLLAAGADPNVQSAKLRFNALQLAAYGCKIPMVKLLLSRGMDVNLRSKERGETLVAIVAPDLHGEPASPEERLAMLDFLLQDGADPNIANNDGKTPLSLSIDPKIRDLLIKYGAKA